MQYTTKIQWKRNANTPFNPKSYDRTHQLQFGGGSSINASSAPEFLGNAELPNPEELFTASIASCFMLTFLYLSAMKGWEIEGYQGEAIGTLAKNDEGKMAMTQVILKLHITFQDNKRPEDTALDDVFKKSHEACFISCSVKTKVIVEHH